MFILKDLNIYLVQNRGAAAACFMAIFSAKKGEIDVCIYSNSLPHRHIPNLKKEEDITPPPHKTCNHFSEEPEQNKTKSQNLECTLSLIFLSSSALALYLSPLYLSSW